MPIITIGFHGNQKATAVIFSYLALSNCLVMVKRLLISISLVVIFANCFAQLKPSDSTTRFVAAINAEQMLEKMGFDNLMKAMFEGKKSNPKIAPKQAANRVIMRKALAAIYGAGINFTKKVLVISNDQAKPTYKNLYSGSGLFETPLRLVVIPVANRQVMQENILKLQSVNEGEGEPKIFKSEGEVNWMVNNNNVTLLSNTELIFASLPHKLYDYNDDVYNGLTIKRDTIITPVEKSIIIDEPIEVTEKVIEIDRLLPTGKIKRVFVLKPEKKLPQNITKSKALKIVKDETVAASAEVVEEKGGDYTTTQVAADTVVAPTSAEPINDTLTRTEYINDSTTVTVYYIPYTDAERDSMIKIYNKQKEEKLQQSALEFVRQYQNFLPQQSQALMATLSADTSDLVMYVSAGGGSPLSSIGGTILGAGVGRSAGFLGNQSASVTSINFTNGLMQMRSRYANKGDSVADLYVKMYQPISDFWPAALGNAPLGNMQVSFNLAFLRSYISNTITQMNKNVDELKREGIDLDEMQQAFTGQLSMAMHAGISKRGKKQPRLLFAVKINDAAKAVAFMNRIGSKKTKFTIAYKFDENASYVLFDTEEKSGLLKQVASQQKMNVPVQGTVMQLNINMPAMMNALTKETQKLSRDYKAGLQFFNKVQLISAVNADSDFTTTFAIDMGSNKTNALYNLLQFISNSSKSTNVVNPLKGLFR
jgi:hypothetical protein